MVLGLVGYLVITKKYIKYQSFNQRNNSNVCKLVLKIPYTDKIKG